MNILYTPSRQLGESVWHRSTSCFTSLYSSMHFGRGSYYIHKLLYRAVYFCGICSGDSGIVSYMNKRWFQNKQKGWDLGILIPMVSAVGTSGVAVCELVSTIFGFSTPKLTLTVKDAAFTKEYTPDFYFPEIRLVWNQCCTTSPWSVTVWQ